MPDSDHDDFSDYEVSHRLTQEKNAFSILFAGIAIGAILSLGVCYYLGLFDCNNSAKAFTKYNQEIAVALDDNAFPYSYYNHKERRMEGFDVDIAKALCRELRVKCKFVPMPLDDIMRSLILGDVQMAVASQSKTKEREPYLAFSIPYYQSHSLFISNEKKLSSINLEDVAFLRNNKVGVVLGSSQAQYIESKYKEAPYNVRLYKNSKLLSIAFEKGEVDFIFVDGYLGHNILRNADNPYIMPLNYNDSDIEALAPAYITVAKDNIKEIEYINTAIENVQRNGVIQSAAQKYLPFLTH